MHLEVITPDRKVFDEEIEELIVKTPAGQIGILPHHAQLVTRVEPGEMTIKIKGKNQYYAVTGGFLEVNENKIKILADYAIHSEDIAVEKALKAKKKAEEILKKEKENIDDRDYARAQSELRKSILELHVANLRRKAR